MIPIEPMKPVLWRRQRDLMHSMATYGRPDRSVGLLLGAPVSMALFDLVEGGGSGRQLGRVGCPHLKSNALPLLCLPSLLLNLFK